MNFEKNASLKLVGKNPGIGFLLTTLVICSTAFGLNGGQLDSANKYPAVGQLRSYSGNGPRKVNPSQGCTATLISSLMALTARHCLSPIAQPWTPVVFFPSFGFVEVVPTGHTQYAKGDASIPRPPFADLAKLSMSDSMPIAPIPIRHDAIGVGQPMTVVAHGPPQQNRRQVGSVSSSNCKKVPDESYICWSSEKQADVSSCPGDSGGAVVTRAGGGEFELVGLVTYGSAGTNRTGTCARGKAENWNTRIGAFTPGFLDSTQPTRASRWQSVRADVIKVLGLYNISNAQIYERIRFVATHSKNDIRILVSAGDCQDEYVGRAAQCEFVPASGTGQITFTVKNNVNADEEIPLSWDVVAIPIVAP